MITHAQCHWSGQQVVVMVAIVSHPVTARLCPADVLTYDLIPVRHRT